MRNTYYLLFLSLIFIPVSSGSQTHKTFNEYIQRRKLSLLKEFSEFISLPNIAGDSINIYRNANFIKNMLEQRGVNAELLTSDRKGASPVVYGEVRKPGAKKRSFFMPITTDSRSMKKIGPPVFCRSDPG